jgi:hypothetical protein
LSCGAAPLHNDDEEVYPMKTLSSWESALASAAPRDHLVQLYTRDASLVASVARFVTHGLRAGDGVIAITTEAHGAAIVARLTDEGVDVNGALERDQLRLLDAEATLEALSVAGMPERARMDAVIRPVIARTRAAGYASVRAFGEMVDLLYHRGRLSAAVRLEELWNELLETERIALLCAYGIDALDRDVYRAALPSIGHVHSHLMPVDDPERLERAIDHAFIDTFGIYGDARLLRELFVRERPAGAAMPTAQAALLALHGVDPHLAGAVLERTASHYRSA